MRRAASALKESFHTLLYKHRQPANSMTLWHIGVLVERLMSLSMVLGHSRAGSGSKSWFRGSLKFHSVPSYREIRLIFIPPAANGTAESEQIETVLNI